MKTLHFCILCLAILAFTACGDDDNTGPADVGAGLQGNHEMSINILSGPQAGESFNYTLAGDEMFSVYIDYGDSTLVSMSWETSEVRTNSVILMRNNTTIDYSDGGDSSILTIQFREGASASEPTYTCVAGTATMSNFTRHGLLITSGFASYILNFNGEFIDEWDPEAEPFNMSGTIKVTYTE